MTRAGPGGRVVLLLLAVVLADQATKALVRGSLERGERVPLLLGIDLVNTRNSGVAFGLLADGGVLLVVVAVAILIGLIAFYLRQAHRPLVWLPTGLLLGGAAGNLLDRVREGSVTDFIDFPLWPAFNVADMAVTIGVVVLVWVLEGAPGRGRRRATV